jgi:leader peptidase (prepilin peptidase) / N-methyltransferase
VPEVEAQRPTQHRAVTLLAALAGGAFFVLSPGVVGTGIALTVALVTHAAATDARTHRIPNRLLAGAALAIALAALVAGIDAVVATCIVAVAWAGLLLVLHLVDTTLGFGDVKLGGVLGALLGLVGHEAQWSVTSTLLASSTAFVAGALLTLIFAARRRASPVPFGPGLVGATSAMAALVAFAA